jgi:GT2 family glycosyltransferase
MRGERRRYLMTIAVVIATYRRPTWLRRAVASLAVQQRTPDQVVIVTKAEDPDSSALARQLRLEHGALFDIVPVVVPRANVVSQENAGIAAATTDIVCFLDDDAVARPDWLERINVYYMRDPRLGGVGGRDVVYTNGVISTSPGKVIGRLRWFGRLHANHHNGARGVRRVHFLKGVNMSYRRAALRPIDTLLVGKLTVEGFEIDMGLAVCAKGLRLLYDPNILVDHYPQRSKDHDARDASMVYFLNHNQTYLLLKYLPPLGKIVAMIYTFSIGDRNTPGLSRALWRQIHHPGTPRFPLRAAISGKLMGAQTYHRARMRHRESQIAHSARSGNRPHASDRARLFWARHTRAASGPIPEATPLRHLIYHGPD